MIKWGFTLTIVQVVSAAIQGDRTNCDKVLEQVMIACGIVLQGLLMMRNPLKYINKYDAADLLSIILLVGIGQYFLWS